MVHWKAYRNFIKDQHTLWSESRLASRSVFNFPQFSFIINITVLSLDFAVRKLGFDLVGAISGLVAKTVRPIVVLLADLLQNGDGIGSLLLLGLLGVDGAQAECQGQGQLKQDKIPKIEQGDFLWHLDNMVQNRKLI